MCRQMYMQKLQKHQYLDCSKIPIIYFTNNVQVTLKGYSTLFRKNTTCQSLWVNFSNSFLKIYFLSSEKESIIALLKRWLQNVDETDNVSLPTTLQENFFTVNVGFQLIYLIIHFHRLKGEKLSNSINFWQLNLQVNPVKTALLPHYMIFYSFSIFEKKYLFTTSISLRFHEMTSQIVFRTEFAEKSKKLFGFFLSEKINNFFMAIYCSTHFANKKNRRKYFFSSVFFADGQNFVKGCKIHLAQKTSPSRKVQFRKDWVLKRNYRVRKDRVRRNKILDVQASRDLTQNLPFIFPNKITPNSIRSNTGLEVIMYAIIICSLRK